MHPQTVLNLGPGIMPDFAIGAQFHAILAWPTIQELEQFQKVSVELMGAALRMTQVADPDLARRVMGDWPQLDWAAIQARAQKRKSAFGYLNKRLAQRMAAARGGIGKVHQRLFGIAAQLPDGMP